MRKPLGGFFPFSDSVKPEPIRIPSTVHAVILAPQICCNVYDLLLFFFCRITKQTVHIVIENNGTAFIIFIRPPDSSSVFCQFSYCSRYISPAYAKANRHCGNFFTGFYVFPPHAFIIRPHKCNIKMSILCRSVFNRPGSGKIHF